MAYIPMPFPDQAGSSRGHGPEEFDSNPDDASGVAISLNGTDAQTRDHIVGELSKRPRNAHICGAPSGETQTPQAGARSGRMGSAAAAHRGKALSADLAMQQCPTNEQASSRRKMLK